MTKQQSNLIRDNLEDFSNYTNSKSYLENTFEKILPNAVKMPNDWYQDGFLYVRFLNDFIEIKTEGATKVIRITNNEQSLYFYLNYLKNFSSSGVVNKPRKQEIKDDSSRRVCKSCSNRK